MQIKIVDLQSTKKTLQVTELSNFYCKVTNVLH